MAGCLTLCHGFTSDGHLVFVLFLRLGHAPTLTTFDMLFSSLNITRNVKIFFLAF